MLTIHDLPTPALIVDLDRLEANVGWMAARARALGVSLRPHVKTHKCPQIARLQAVAAASRFTVSTLHEARAFAERGFDDLTWAFPLIFGRIEEAREIAGLTTLRLVVDSPEAVAALEATGEPFPVWLKVDCGYHRAGVDPGSGAAVELARRLAASATLRFEGLLTHSGHAYQAGSRREMRAIARQECQVTTAFAERLRAEGIEVPGVSVGSTPALAVAEELPGVTEIRPGNYVFFDHTQVVLGSCRPTDCAVTVVASVVSRGSGGAVIDAGALALSKDPGPAAGHPTMGEIFADYEAGELETDLRVAALSQEHGILSGNRPVGGRVRILPNHSCLTVACFDEYAVARGDEVVDRWPVLRGRS